MLGRNAERFRGGLVFKAHRYLYHSTPGFRVIEKKKGGRRGAHLAFSRFQKSPQLKTYPSPAAVLVASLSANLESVLKLTWSRCTTLVLLFPLSMMLLLVLKAAKMWTCPSWVLFASFSARTRRQLREPDAAGLQSCCSAMARPGEASHASNNLSQVAGVGSTVRGVHGTHL